MLKDTIESISNDTKQDIEDVRWIAAKFISMGLPRKEILARTKATCILMKSFRMDVNEAFINASMDL